MFKNLSTKNYVNLEDTNSPIKLIRPLSGGKSGAFVFQADYVLSMVNAETIGSVGTNIAKTAITYSIVEGSKRTLPLTDKILAGVASMVNYSKINERIYKYNENVKQINLFARETIYIDSSCPSNTIDYLMQRFDKFLNLGSWQIDKIDYTIIMILIVYHFISIIIASSNSF